MNLIDTICLDAGGPGSGRHPGSGRSKTVYHGTDAKNLRAILKEGLRRGQPSNYQVSKSDKIYLAQRLGSAKTYAEQVSTSGRNAVIEFEVPPEMHRKFEADQQSEGDLVHHGDIPAQYIRAFYVGAGNHWTKITK